MEVWTSDYLLHKAGQHIASEPHIRVQILEISSSLPGGYSYHGELLLLILSGACTVRTEKENRTVNVGDQVLLTDGEKFEIALLNEAFPVIVQMIWTPGMNPCKVCWDNDARFFSGENES